MVNTQLCRHLCPTFPSQSGSDEDDGWARHERPFLLHYGYGDAAATGSPPVRPDHSLPTPKLDGEAAAMAATRCSPSPLSDHLPGGRRLLQRYQGHSNVQTDIKEVCFVGAGDEIVAAGSDDGCVMLYDAMTGRVLRALEADEDVANCVQVRLGVGRWGAGDGPDRSWVEGVVEQPRGNRTRDMCMRGPIPLLAVCFRFLLGDGV